MNVLYIKENALEQLKTNIDNNIGKYLLDDKWINEYLQSIGWEEWNIQSRLFMNDINLVVDPTDRGKNDAENSKRIYSALKDITPTQASDERLWAYLTHVTYWDYMKARWNVETRLEGNPKNFVTERYFFASNRQKALVRNGIARLWWYGYVSFDDTRDNPFELTDFLLSKQDLATSLMERQYSNNRDFIIATLSVLKEYEQVTPSILTKKPIQALTKHIQHIGGVSILDALDREDIKRLVEKWLLNTDLIKSEEKELESQLA
ncbi:hypothetical protein C518_2414 [Lysinibacillus fusiformis ZB2]|nr:hypothetical protein C518_2414 [Lysinibacillus fusiformis ZB2]